MPEIRPTINKINAFDAKLGTTISFSWTGAQSQANRVVIREYDSPHRIVYDCKQKTMALKHTLHLTGKEEGNINQQVAYALTNGSRYTATVYTYDIYGNESLASAEVAFYCFHTPTFEFINFTNIDANGIAKVTVNSVYLNVKYEQQDNEVINEYQFILYDYQGNILTQSVTKYGSTANDTLTWTLGGVTETDKTENGELNYGRAYKIACQATTLHGMSLVAEQKFVVMKDTGGVGALLTLEVLPDHTISISSHFKIVNAELNGEEVYLYDSNNKPYALDLTDGQVLSFFDGFIMQEPWSLTGIVKDCTSGEVLLKATNNQGDSFSISYHEKRYSLVEKCYYLFECTRQTTKFILRSDYLPITTDWKVIYLKYIDGYYTFKIYDPEDIGYSIPE